jgi:hypothetical protein
MFTRACQRKEPKLSDDSTNAEWSLSEIVFEMPIANKPDIGDWLTLSKVDYEVIALSADVSADGRIAVKVRPIIKPSFVAAYVPSQPKRKLRWDLRP